MCYCVCVIALHVYNFQLKLKMGRKADNVHAMNCSDCIDFAINTATVGNINPTWNRKNENLTWWWIWSSLNGKYYFDARKNMKMRRWSGKCCRWRWVLCVVCLMKLNRYSESSIGLYNLAWIGSASHFITLETWKMSPTMHISHYLLCTLHTFNNKNFRKRRFSLLIMQNILFYFLCNIFLIFFLYFHFSYSECIQQFKKKHKILIFYGLWILIWQKWKYANKNALKTNFDGLEM